jgi:hypothetical protein
MKNLLFTLVFIGMLLLCVSIVLSNVYLLGLSELFLIVPAFFAIKQTIKKF